MDSLAKLPVGGIGETVGAGPVGLPPVAGGKTLLRSTELGPRAVKDSAVGSGVSVGSFDSVAIGSLGKDYLDGL